MNRRSSFLMLTVMLVGLGLGLGLTLAATSTLAQDQPSVTYQVQEGDSLWEIAVRFYGTGTRWTEIAEANGFDVANPRSVRTGETLIIPGVSAARTLTVRVGFGQDTTTVNAFFPGTLRIRVGDTLTWKIESDEIHTVTFTSGAEPPSFEVPVPGGGPGELMINPQGAFPTRFPGAPVETYSGTGFFNSGIMLNEPLGPDEPPNDTFTLTFDTPGAYRYLCLLHPFMEGTVIVGPATATDVPEQAEIDAQAQIELAPLKAITDAIQGAIASGQAVESESGPNGTDIWLVQAGPGVPQAEVYDFLPKKLTVKQGDTVVWNSPGFHNVAFVPVPPPPEFVVPVPQDQGPPLLTLNPQVVLPAKPSAEFDPTQYYNSGLIGPGELPGGFGGFGFSLTFNEVGTFKYFCLIHRELGMEGTITVVPRE